MVEVSLTTAELGSETYYGVLTEWTADQLEAVASTITVATVNLLLFHIAVELVKAIQAGDYATRDHLAIEGVIEGLPFVAVHSCAKGTLRTTAQYVHAATAGNAVLDVTLTAAKADETPLPDPLQGVTVVPVAGSPTSFSYTLPGA